MESIHLSTMCATYNHQFAIYSKDKTKVTQLIAFAVWKVVYAAYKMEYPYFNFQEETLKERFQETLQKLKIGTLNQEGLERVVLRNEDVLA